MTEMTMQPGVRPTAWRGPSALWLAACAFILAVFFIKCAAPLLEARNDIVGMLQDDAFYYIIPAANIAHGLGSTFDGISQTNGYHPLWMLIETGLSVLGVPGVGGAIGAALVLNVIGMGLVLWLFRRQPPWFLLLAAGVYFHTTNSMATQAGMETDLLAATFLGLLAALQASMSRPAPILVGVCATLCILARLDDALFIIPIVAAATATWRERAVAGAIVFGTLFIYAAGNLVFFGLPMPVSGEVKGLGGLQINYPLLHDIENRFTRGVGLTGKIKEWVGEPFVIYAVLVAVASALYVTIRSRSRYLLAALVVGIALYVTREVFFSSWRTWPWYLYPLFLGSMTLLFVLSTDRQWRAPDRRNWPALAMMVPLGALFLVQGFAGAPLRAWRALHGNGQGFALGFYRLNERAAGIMNGLAPGGRVAMGDRSGSFAYYYSGHVVQLEGLMNDAAYFRLLSHGGDAKAFLCQRGVQYVIAYSGQNGDYTSMDIPVVRPSLSDFPRYPVLHVSRQDQVMELADAALYTGDNGDHDDTIYAWRLSGCPGS